MAFSNLNASLTPRARRILVVEDDPAYRAVVCETLREIADEVVATAGVAEALESCTASPPDLVVLDLGLPDGEGMDVLTRLRPVTLAPVIVLSGRNDEEERVKLLDAGADDFIAKPCNAAELLARARGHLRRRMLAHNAELRSRIVAGEVEIDLIHMRVRRGSVEQRLTPTEWALLRTLVLHAGQTLSAQQLWDFVWAREFGEPQLHVRVHVTHLRRKIEPDPSHPSLIVTELGLGYRFEVP